MDLRCFGCCGYGLVTIVVGCLVWLRHVVWVVGGAGFVLVVCLYCGICINSVGYMCFVCRVTCLFWV